jgi:Tol biopolymer transport system component/DNA-binding winged helix-turn-helix (wHTH) protein
MTEISSAFQSLQADAPRRSDLRLRIAERVVDFGALRVVDRPDCPRLTSKAAAVLLELARNAGSTLTRDELLDRVWAGRCTTPDVLTQAIKELRRALLDDSRTPHIIETIPKVGYRLLADVSVVGDDATGAPAANGLADHEAGAPAHPDDDGGNPPPPAAHAPGGRRFLVAGIAVAVAAAGVAAGWRHAHVPAPVPAAPAITAAAPGARVTNQRSITSAPGAERRPDVSPDGTRVAYARWDPDSGYDRILIRSIDPSRTIDLTTRPVGHEAMPAWSPDGSQIAFERITRDTCTLYVASSLGGNEREIGDCGNLESNYFDWTPDGRQLITAQPIPGGSGKLALVYWNLATGVQTPVAYPHHAVDQDMEAHYSPDGRWLAFRRGMAPYSDLCVMPAAGGAVRQVTHLATRIRGYTWSSDSRELVFSSNQSGRSALYGVDIASGEVRDLGVAPAEYPNAAPHGNTAVYEIPRTRNTLARIGLAPDAEPETLAESTGSDGTPALAPDGRRLVFVSDRSGAQNLWLYDAADANVVPLTNFHDAALIAPEWSPDGDRVLVTVRRGATAELVEIGLASRRQHVVSSPGENVLFGNYASDAADYLMALGRTAASDRLVLVSGGDGSRGVEQVVANGVEYARVDREHRQVYFTRAGNPGLFRRSLAGGEVQRVTLLITPVMLDGWRVVDGRIWYLSGMDMEPVDVHEFDPASGNDRLLARLAIMLKDVNFSVTPARDGIVVARVGVEDIDVGAFDLAPLPVR